MNYKQEGLIGPAAVAKKLQNWQQTERPDLINATIDYIAQEWFDNRQARIAAVYSVYVKFRNLGAKGDSEAAVLAVELERLLARHGSLELRFKIPSTPMRRRTDRAGELRH